MHNLKSPPWVPDSHFGWEFGWRWGTLSLTIPRLRISKVNSSTTMTNAIQLGEDKGGSVKNVNYGLHYTILQLMRVILKINIKYSVSR